MTVQFRRYVYQYPTFYFYVLVNSVLVYILLRQKDFNWRFFLFFLVIELFWTFYFGKGLNYFIVEGETFIIKNTWLFWRKYTYSFSEIEKIEFNFIYREGVTISIISKNGKKRGFIAAMLSKNQLIEMRNYLRSTHLSIKENISLDNH